MHPGAKIEAAVLTKRNEWRRGWKVGRHSTIKKMGLPHCLRPVSMHKEQGAVCGGRRRSWLARHSTIKEMGPPYRSDV